MLSLGLKAFDFLGLLIGQHFGANLIEAQPARDGLGRRAVVAREHDHPKPVFAQVRDRRGGRILDRIGNADQSGGLPVDQDEHDRLALAAQSFGMLAKLLAGNAKLFEQRSIPHHHRPAVDLPLDALPGVGLEMFQPSPPRAPFPGGRGNRRGQRVLAGDFDAGGQPEHLPFVLARHRHDRDHAWLSLGERAGLVDDERVDAFQNLERLGILDQHAGRGAAARADHDRHRRRQPERARAGDDQHGDGIDQRVSQARLRAEECPGQKVIKATMTTAGTK